MRNADIILDYAYEHNETIVHKEFVHWFKEMFPAESVRSMDTTLQRLLASGILLRTGYGVLKLGKDVKPCFRPAVNQEMQRMFSEVRQRYPYTGCCIWQASELVAFMQHVPSLDVLILEVEKMAAESVYEDVKELADSTRKVLLNPSEREYRLYASGERSLLVKSMVSESPLQTMDGIAMPMLEKILVDATVSPELEFARGGEIFTIFENAGEMYRINRKMMLRYAARRGKKEEIEKLINATMP